MRFIKSLIITLIVAVVVCAEEPFYIGEVCAAIQVSCTSQKEAENLAAAFLSRGKSRHLQNKKQYHYSVGTIVFTVIDTVAVLQKGDETLFIIEALSIHKVYLVSRIPALNRPEPTDKSTRLSFDYHNAKGAYHEYCK